MYPLYTSSDYEDRWHGLQWTPRTPTRAFHEVLHVACRHSAPNQYHAGTALLPQLCQGGA
jgi:hypothetical protein